MKNENDFEGRTIDITPKWGGIIHPMLEVFRTYKEKRGSRGIDSTLADLKVEFLRMAKAADQYNEIINAEKKVSAKKGGTLKFVLEINMDTGAFGDHPIRELSRILLKLQREVYLGRMDNGKMLEDKVVVDTNGVPVGTAKVMKEKNDE